MKSVLLVATLVTAYISGTTVTATIACCQPGETSHKATADCTSFYQCVNGEVSATLFPCPDGLLFDENIVACDYAAQVTCDSDDCGQNTTTTNGASSVGAGSIVELSDGTSTSSSSSSSMPIVDVDTSIPSSASTIQMIESILEASRGDLEKNVLVYESADGFLPSDLYNYDGFVKGLNVVYQDGIANNYFYLGNDEAKGHLYGLVNIAAFLAQAMKESIKYNACDENNWDLVDGRYPISNSCGQLQQSYQDYQCAPDEADMACPVDTEMTIQATTHATWYGAPKALYCGPRSLFPSTGYWDYSAVCDDPWTDPPKYCEDYDGQKAGKEVNDTVVANRNGRTDVEGCCWWGRGVIQTTGVCNFGRLNYYLGKRAADEGRASRYPTIDFCKDPQVICSSKEFEELRWVVGLFYWMNSVQNYESGGWNYMQELHNFVNGGMEGTDFIDAVSGIVNRGCHNPPCASGSLDGGPERAENFVKVLQSYKQPASMVTSETPPTDGPVETNTPNTDDATATPTHGSTTTQAPTTSPTSATTAGLTQEPTPPSNTDNPNTIDVAPETPTVPPSNTGNSNTTDDVDRETPTVLASGGSNTSKSNNATAVNGNESMGIAANGNGAATSDPTTESEGPRTSDGQQLEAGQEESTATSGTSQSWLITGGFSWATSLMVISFMLQH